MEWLKDIKTFIYDCGKSKNNFLNVTGVDILNTSRFTANCNDVNGMATESNAIGYLLSQRGDSAFGLGGWWSLEVGGTKGTFVIENCIEKLTYWPAPVPANAAKPEAMSMGTSGGPQVFDSGIKDFNETFPRRLHGFLEDITAKVPLEKLRASGRDALAALEYTWAAMESYEQGGILVRPHPLPLLKGDPTTELD